MLIKAIRSNVFIPPFKDKAVMLNEKAIMLVRPAPKITSKDREIAWDSWTAEDILRRHRIIGPLWNTVRSADGLNERGKRIIWSKGFQQIETKPSTTISPGQPFVAFSESNEEATYVRTCDNQVFQIESIKIEGGEEDVPSRAARRAGLRPKEASPEDLNTHILAGSNRRSSNLLFIGSFNGPR